MTLQQEHFPAPALAVGIDIGSTTTKVAVLDPNLETLLYSDYQRHHAHQAQSVLLVLETLEQKFPGQAFRFCFTGSGAKPIAEGLQSALCPGGGGQCRRPQAPLPAGRQRH